MIPFFLSVRLSTSLWYSIKLEKHDLVFPLVCKYFVGLNNVTETAKFQNLQSSISIMEDFDRNVSVAEYCQNRSRFPQ